MFWHSLRRNTLEKSLPKSISAKKVEEKVFSQFFLWKFASKTRFCGLNVFNVFSPKIWFFFFWSAFANSTRSFLLEGCFHYIKWLDLFSNSCSDNGCGNVSAVLKGMATTDIPVLLWSEQLWINDRCLLCLSTCTIARNSATSLT